VAGGRIGAVRERAPAGSALRAARPVLLKGIVYFFLPFLPFFLLFLSFFLAIVRSSPVA